MYVIASDAQPNHVIDRQQIDIVKGYKVNELVFVADNPACSISLAHSACVPCVPWLARQI